MSIKLTDTQLVLLGAAARRKDLCLVAPPTLKGATAQKVASKLISAGFVKEVKARASDPIWRRDEESGAPYVLKLTAAALQGDLGNSLFSGESIVSMIAQRVPPTVSLMILTLLISVSVAVPLGVVAAAR
jgi:ABC-type dipeptide/oligopeptide/nickel transport system permease component